MNDNILSCMHFHTWQFASKDIYVVMFRIKILQKREKMLCPTFLLNIFYSKNSVKLGFMFNNSMISNESL